jgi:hypothetical protein
MKPDLLQAVDRFIQVNAPMWEGQDPEDINMNENRELRHIDQETNHETTAFIGICHKCKKEGILIQETTEEWRAVAELDAKDLPSFCWRHVVIEINNTRQFEKD